MNNKRIRTRYAPSPTGYFHIGGARTAIFNYLFAKANNGDFIVRIEDTDIERNVDGGIESQLKNIKWLGVKIDESIEDGGKYGPYIQSLNLEKYQKLAKSLVDNNKAYYCFCSKEQLDIDRENAIKNHQTPRYKRTCRDLSVDQINQKLKQNIPYTIRLKIDDDKHYEWDDLIRGKISVPGYSLTDPVILKANKIPMYNFAVVIDDYYMNISHVLRGEEHISNTPYQLAITSALGYDNSIKYGHLSIIVDKTGKKLSKRDQSLKQFVEDYQKIGCPSAALFNFLALLSWTPPTSQEILSREELIKQFNLEALSKSPAFFDEQKLKWTANEYFKKMEIDEYNNFVLKFIDQSLVDKFNHEQLIKMIALFKNQISFATELNDLIKTHFINFEFDLNDDHFIIAKENVDVVQTFLKQIESINSFTETSIANCIEQTKQITNKKAKNLFMPIRLSSTTKSSGPELAKVISLINKHQVIQNINTCLKHLKK